MKKTLVALGLGVLASLMFVPSVMYANNSSTVNGSFGDTTSVGGLSGLGVGDSTAEGAGFIGVIKTAINYVLGLLSLIALIILLYGGFQMVVSAGDQGKFDAGFAVLKNAGIGLIFIGLSWLFVSFILRFVGSLSN